MMDQLISFGAEMERGLRETFSGEEVRGVSIDVDDYWEFSQLVYLLDERPYYPPFGYFDDYYDREYRGLREYLRMRSSVVPQKTDFNYRPADWADYCRRQGYPENADPRIIRV